MYNPGGSNNNIAVRSITPIFTGRVYGIAGKGTALLALTRNPTRGLTIDTAGYTPTIIDVWGFNEGMKV